VFRNYGSGSGRQFNFGGSGSGTLFLIEDPGFHQFLSPPQSLIKISSFFNI
jgi:hypothetical protein